MSSDRKSKKQKRKPASDNIKELSTIRKTQSRLNNIQAMLSGNSSDLKILDELAKLRDLLTQLEAGIFRNHLRGSLNEAMQNKDGDAVENAICRLADHFSRKDSQ